MVMPVRREGAQFAPPAGAGSDERPTRPVLGRSGVLPVLPPGRGRVVVLCPAEDLAYAEKELLQPLLQAGFQAALKPVRPDAAPGWIREMLDPPCRLVLLGIAPEDPGGYDLCAELRDGLGLPLMLVLREAARDDLLRGYEAGADSCLSAPFDVREFLARLAALLRRQPENWKDGPTTE